MTPPPNVDRKTFSLKGLFIKSLHYTPSLLNLQDRDKRDKACDGC